MTVTFSNLAHPYPADLDCLLVGPQGQKVMLMSDAGSDSAPIRFLTFDDAAPDLLPRYEPLASGTYQPTDYEPANLPAPAPAGPYPLSLASMNVTNGNGVWSLYIADHFAGEVGPLGGWSVNLSVTADVRDVPRLVAQPVSLVATQGLPTVLSAQATGARPLRFQWLFHGGPLEGATADSLTLPEVTPAQAGGYSLVVSNLFGVVTSQVAVLTVLVPPTLGFSPVSRSVVAGRMISWAVTAVGSPPLQYQWVFNGTNLANGPRILRPADQCAGHGERRRWAVEGYRHFVRRPRRKAAGDRILAAERAGLSEDLLPAGSGHRAEHPLERAGQWRGHSRGQLRAQAGLALQLDHRPALYAPHDNGIREVGVAGHRRAVGGPQRDYPGPD